MPILRTCKLLCRCQLIGAKIVCFRLRFDDCIISGVSQFSATKLVVLAYGNGDDDSDNVETRKGNKALSSINNQHRRKGVSPELRMIDTNTKDELEADTLTVTKFQSLSVGDYHLDSIYVPKPQAMPSVQRGTLDALSGGLRDAGVSAGRILSSGASAVSFSTSGDNVSSVGSQAQGVRANATGAADKHEDTAALTSPGPKIFIHSPYDCIVAVTRDLSDRLNWLLEHQKYKDCWELLEEHPKITTTGPTKVENSSASTSSRTEDSLAEFFADDDQKTISGKKPENSAAEKEKRRIGDLWLKQLVEQGDWETAGQIAGKVLSRSSEWEHWMWRFAHANRFDEITPYIPTVQLHPRLPSLVYEAILGHYIHHDAVRFKVLIDRWDTDLFNVSAVTSAIEDKLDSGDVSEDSVESGEKGRDWRIFMEALAKLYVTDHKPRQALKCFIRLKYAQEALDLIRDYKLLYAIADDIPGFLMLRVSMEQIEDVSIQELAEASDESVKILADEAYQGTVKAEVVVSQLEKAGPKFRPFLYFYFSALWRGDSSKSLGPKRRQQQATEGKALVDQFGNLVVDMYAEFDRSLLMEFLRVSQSYSYEHATAVCERRQYVQEHV